MFNIPECDLARSTGDHHSSDDLMCVYDRGLELGVQRPEPDRCMLVAAGHGMP
jgi:hypothetical protein